MKKSHLIISSLLLGTLLTACTSQQTSGNRSSATEITTAVTQETAASTPTITENDASKLNEEANPTPEPSAEAEIKNTAPLYSMNEVYRFVPIEQNTTNKVVLLTFDDGPKDQEVLTSLLDTLDKHEAKAIFFVNGYRVKQNPDLLKLIDERGQTIGNHSWDHIILKNETEAVVEKQIYDVQAAVEALVDKKPLFFRPPYGSGGDTVKKIAKNHGMLYMTWSNGSLDWDKSAKDKPEVVIKNVLEQLHPGANILMHELKWTADSLDELLTALENKGYGFIDPASININP
ncbi:polysaccharide deacetylase family protein [Paenibacillus sp. LHD-38]|uniref:polysaccharide deacetylase family protein n=1 Tax=Paenibacillus sp. LHD-38 TaxID=3072143 RepID=UPI00280DC09A|nr:polysaccharide deacetylase family protein [Paenibacillus sp. LHD-38]MDQ8735487.1 polysaccharide deacetylase family protein [Paenibacillus sp. LHD-38]